jgi:hypothetical protein
VPEVGDPVADDPEAALVQPAGPFLAVAGDERGGVPLVQELDGRLDLDLPELEVLGDPGKVEGR